MFQRIKFKLNRKQAINKLNEFCDVEIHKYTAKCRLIDGTEIYIGKYYAHTSLDFDRWIKDMLRDNVIHTDSNTYVKSQNIIEAECHSVDSNMIKYHYKDYFDLRTTRYYSNKEIEENVKEYKKLLTLSKIK